MKCEWDGEEREPLVGVKSIEKVSCRIDRNPMI